MSEPLINVNQVSKTYNSKIILSDINLSIYEGQSIALTGHNGSGKSTLLRIISGLTNVDSGHIEYKRKLKFGYIPEHFPKMNLNAYSYLSLIGGIEGLDSQYVQEKSMALLKLFFMEDMIHTPMKDLSKGSLQKVGVIQALLTKPDVLLLDEPLSGQDSDSQEIFISYIKDYLKQGVTVILSCHEPFLVDSLSHIRYEINGTRLVNMGTNSINTNTSSIGTHNNVKKMDHLIFTMQNTGIELKSDIIQDIHQIDYKEDTLELIVTPEKSNHVIYKMIEDGYQLRRMFHE